jgi:hypothetical protein
MHRRARNRRPRHPISNHKRRRHAFLRLCRSIKLQEMLRIERVERPEDLVVRVDFLLAPAYRRELEIQQEPPKLRRSLGAVADGGDEVVVEFGEERPASILKK